MQVVTIFDPSITSSDSFSVPQSSANGKMVVYNESNISLQFTFQNGYSAYVPAWMAVLFHGPFGNVNVTWEQQTILTGAGQAPLTQVVVEVYDCHEPIPGTYPAALVRQTNIGNSVPVSTSTSNIVNDGNASGTQVIEATVSGDASSAVVLTNNAAVTLGNATHNAAVTLTGNITQTGNQSITGNVTVAGTTSMTLGTGHTVLATGGGAQTHFDDAKIYTDGNGTLVVTQNLDVNGTTNLAGLSITGNIATSAGNLSVHGTSSLDNGAITTDGSGNLSAASFEPTTTGTKPKISADGSGNINFDVPAGTRIAQVNAGGLDLTTSGTYDITCGQVHVTNDFKFNNGQTMSKISTFSGTTTGTYNHNLGGTPAIVLPMQNVVGSQTMGYDSLTSTQVHITSAAGASFKAFCWA